MSRIEDCVLDELIKHNGELKHLPINRAGILRLALDLKEARKEIARLGLIEEAHENPDPERTS